MDNDNVLSDIEINMFQVGSLQFDRHKYILTTHLKKNINYLLFILNLLLVFKFPRFI